MPDPLWLKTAKGWKRNDPDRWEDFAERVAIILEACSAEGITEEEAQKRAFDCCAKRP